MNESKQVDEQRKQKNRVEQVNKPQQSQKCIECMNYVCLKHSIQQMYRHSLAKLCTTFDFTKLNDLC